MTKNRQLMINVVGNVIAFCANLIINFFLSPYIIKKLGVEANGYILLANNFIGYASLVTIALNSMAGRYITIKYHQRDIDGANKYYTAVRLGNILLAIFMAVPAVFCIIYLEQIIRIPHNLLVDVKLLFGLVFIEFLMSMVTATWGTALFIRNKLHLQSIRTVQSTLIKMLLIVGLFFLFNPSVYFIGVATLVSSIFIAAYSLYYKKKLLPDIKIVRKSFDVKALWDLVSSGIWNTILKGGQLLLSGLDLLIANLFIGSTAMGVLALSKTAPNVITQFAATLTSAFTPSLTINFAKGDINEVTKDLKKGMKLTGIVLTIPLSILIVFGKEFYSLWVPSQDAALLQTLSILACFGLIFTSGIQSLYNIFTVLNKLKPYSLLILLSGIISTGIVLILLKTTNLGIIAIAAVSSCINLIRNMFYTVPYAAKYLNLKWNTFLPEVGSSIFSVLILVIIEFCVKQLFKIDSWYLLFISVFIAVIPGFTANVFIVLNKKEREYLIHTALKHLPLLQKKIISN